ncbi:hypothetical protein ACUUL3_06125 [Thiovibrio sp. JS02]
MPIRFFKDTLGQSGRLLLILVCPLFLYTGCGGSPSPSLLPPATLPPVLAGATGQDLARLRKILASTPSYETVQWKNETEIAFSVTPRPVFKEEGGLCRKALVERELGAEKSKAEITACRLEAHWQLLD